MAKVRACLVGAGGRMGQQIINAAGQEQQDYAVDITYGLVSAESPLRGNRIDGVAEPLCSFDDAAVSKAEVIIDFSSPQSAKRSALLAESLKLPLVIGTTGLSGESKALLKELSRHVPVLCSANMSVGMNMMFWLASVLGKKLGNEFDAEIVELHHGGKKDAPSGSALTLASEIAAARGDRIEDVICAGRQGVSSGRGRGEIGVQAVRGGDVPGEHTLYFLGHGERIEITHRVSNRLIFAQGALKAASWIVNQPPGLYSMRDVLGLKQTV